MNQAEYVRGVLEEFVRVPSSVDADPMLILKAAATAAEDLGLTPTIHRDVKALTASSGHGGLLMNGHLDTVPMGSGWTKMPGSWDGDFLYGRGTADMKAGCAAALGAARTLLDRAVPFGLLFTTDEETTMAGAKRLAPSGLVRDAAAVVVGEPTALHVVASEKGVLWYRLSTKGRSAHGSLPHLGDNAIYRMAAILPYLETWTKPKDPAADMTINLGAIRGGSAPNVVADTCSIDLDCRNPPGTSKADVERILGEAVRSSGQDASIELFHEVPAAASPPDAAHVRLLKELAGTQVTSVTYGTEMAFFIQHNPLCVVFGPGDPTGIHGPDERVSLAETVRAADLLAQYAERLASPSR